MKWRFPKSWEYPQNQPKSLDHFSIEAKVRLGDLACTQFTCMYIYIHTHTPNTIPQHLLFCLIYVNKTKNRNIYTRLNTHVHRHINYIYIYVYTYINDIPRISQHVSLHQTSKRFKFVKRQRDRSTLRSRTRLSRRGDGGGKDPENTGDITMVDGYPLVNDCLQFANSGNGHS